MLVGLERVRSWLGGLAGGGRPRHAGVARRVDQVAPWLFIGPELLPDQYQDLRDRGVTHVLDLRREASDDSDSLAALGLQWRRIPIPDRHAPTHEQLASIVEWLDGAADPVAEQAVYVHCQGGLGRTPTVAIALLMQHDLTLGEAQRLVVSARPESAPTQPQLRWLEEVEARLRPDAATG